MAGAVLLLLAVLGLALLALLLVLVKRARPRPVTFVAGRRLAGKVVWVTGASSGIGEAIAYRCAVAGARVVVSARREAELQRVKSKCASLAREAGVPEADDGVCQVYVLDCGQLGDAERHVNAVFNLYGRVDAIVLNAGVSVRERTLATKLEVDRALMEVNFFSAIAITKAASPRLLQQGGGNIAVVGSVQGKLGMPMRSAYAASKHAVQGWFDSYRVEMMGKGVQVLLAVPGYVRTNLSINALRGDGGLHGAMDESTAKGFDPLFVADQILQAMVDGEEEIIVADASAHLGMALRYLFPRWLNRILLRRLRKESLANASH